MPIVYLMQSQYQRYIQLSLILFVAILFVTTGMSASVAASATVVAVSGNSNSRSEQQYKKASNYYYRLERDPSLGHVRSNWLNGVHDFQRIYRSDPKSITAPSCLYMIGRMYRRMYQLFKVTTDIDESIGYYTDVFSFFPESDKADDALYNIAQIQAADKGNPFQAAKTFRKLISRYPAGSLKAQSEKQLLELDTELERLQRASEHVAGVDWDSVPEKPAQPRIYSETGKPTPVSAPTAENNQVSAAEKRVRKTSVTPVKQPPKKAAAASKLPSMPATPLVAAQVPIEKKKAITLDPAVIPLPEPVKVTESKPDSRKNRQPEKQQSITVISAKTGSPVVKPVLAKNSAVANVMPVKYWSSDNYSRVVIRASSRVKFKSKLLDKNGKKPRRLYIDFYQSHIPDKYRTPVPIEDGLLKQVRTGQFNDKTVRVVLDIESISDYKIFSLNDPFRVVVDVRGVKKPRAVTAPREKRAPPEIQTVVTEGTTKYPVIILSDRKKIKPRAAKRIAAQVSEVSGSDATANLSLAQQLGLGVHRIVIDPGHGGKDPGAMAFGLKEKEIVIKVAHKVEKILKNRYKYEVILTRTGDTYLPLEERTAIANTKDADLFLSIHVNAHPKKSAKGVETFYLNLATNKEAMRVAARENATSTHNINELQDILSDLMQNAKINESSKLAQYVQTSMVTGLKEKKYRVKNLGVKQAPFYVLIGAQMPAVLAEISFITNPGDARLLGRKQYLYDIASQIAAGLHGYANKQLAAGGGR
jgi:N-acetylmuramoyl-L-alanine amidase